MFLVDLRPGRQPIPEQVGQRGATAAAVGGGMGVQLAEMLDADLRAWHQEPVRAVDARENSYAQADHDVGQPPGRAADGDQRNDDDSENDEHQYSPAGSRNRSGPIPRTES